MDVIRLAWFTHDNKAHLSEEILLQNTNLIICLDDLANNLYIWMCQDRKSPPNYGSDLFGPNLVVYAQIVEGFFNLLKHCSIKPIIVQCRGLSRTGEKKELNSNHLQTDLHKRKTKGKKDISKLKYIPELEKTDRPEPPPLIYLIFKQIIKKLAIETRHFNEKYRFGMIKLANELDCPLLTFCCDYLMYPMRKGFIRLDSDFFDRQNIVLDDMNNKCIRCRLFSHRKLLTAVPGLQSKSVPFLAVVKDIRSKSYPPIYRALSSIWKRNETRLVHNRYRQNKIIGSYLEWMRGKSWWELICEFCHKLNGGSDEVMRTLENELKKAMQERVYNEIGLDYKTILESYYKQQHNADSTKLALNYLINLVEELQLDTFILHIMTTRQVYHDCIYLNDLNQHSTNCLKIRPYSVVLCLLRPTALVDEPVKENSIWLYDRLEDNHYGRRVVREARDLEGFGSLDYLHINSLLSLSDDHKKKLLLSTFRVESEKFDGEASLENKELINEIRLCLTIVKYINEESKRGDYKTAPLDRSFVKSLILTCLFYMTSKFDRPSSGLPVEDVLVVRRELEVVKGTPNVYDNPEMYWAIVHQMSSIECAIDTFCMLNSLLGQVFPRPRVEVWFDGPLIFKLARMIETGQLEGLTCLKLPILNTIVLDLFPEARAVTILKGLLSSSWYRII